MPKAQVRRHETCPPPWLQKPGTRGGEVLLTMFLPGTRISISHATTVNFQQLISIPYSLHNMLPTLRRRSAALAQARPHIRPTSPGLPRVCPAVCRASRASYSQFSTDTTSSSSVSGKPSAIAQRLPSPDTIHAPHRFREFEVCRRASSFEQ